MAGVNEELRKLPSVDDVLLHPDMAEIILVNGRSLAAEAVREALDEARAAIRSGDSCPPPQMLMTLVRRRIVGIARSSLRQAINATGVIVHTNLGRAPLSEAARQAMANAGTGYSNLEYDLATGGRGSRYSHSADLLCRLTGSEAALVVNNNAGAVLLVLTALAKGREVVISRGQLVEIGGGFRIPDVMTQSGARLVEVGTTNRTYVRDFEAAIGPASALLFSAHRSNFSVSGFAEDATLKELVELGRRHHLPVVNDLGSGTLIDTSRFGLPHEPTVQASVQAGVSVTTFSGDKLLGGPQAGILVGQRSLIERVRPHPLTRALRVDKTTLAGLHATLLHYLRGESTETVPVWRMISRPLGEIRAQAEAWATQLRAYGIPADTCEGYSTIGGGSMPGGTLPSVLVALRPQSPDAAFRHLRRNEPPVVARVDRGRLLIDPRTVQPEEGGALLSALRTAWQDLE